MRFIRLTLRSYLPAVPVLLALCVYVWPSPARTNGSPAFYLATDRSFTGTETPYVNLEASGYAAVEFRIYRIRDPRTFFRKQVRSRFVQESDPAAVGNPFALFRNSLREFHADFQKIARREFNVKTRTRLRETLDILPGLERPGPTGTPDALAMPGLRTEHEFLRSFQVPTLESHWSYRRVPVPVSENGIYLVEAVYGKSLAYTVVVRSGLTFLTKQSDAGTVVYAAGSQTGEPARNARVDLFDGDTGADLASGRTGSDGIFRSGKGTPTRTLVVVQLGDEYALSDPDFFASSFYGQGGSRVFMYTDRPIYRPGDRVYFKAIGRRFSGNDYRPLGGPARISVLDDQGNAVITGMNVTLGSATGTADGSFTLTDDENASLGTYKLILTTEQRSFSAEFRVDAYRKPKFRVRVSTPKQTYGKDDTIPIRVNASYYYGKALAGATVNVRVFRTPKFDYSPVGHFDFQAAASYLGATGGATSRELVLDQNSELDTGGVLEIRLRPENVEQDYAYAILASITAEDATITGSGGFSVNRSPFYMKVLRENQVYGPGETARLTVQLVPFDQTLTGDERQSVVASRPVRATLYSRYFQRISEEADRKQIATTTVTSDASGRARLEFRVPRSGHYLIELASEAADGSETTAEITLWASGRQDTIEMPVKNLKLTAGKDLYQVGEMAEILIVSPVADASVFLSLEGSRLYHQESVALQGNTLRYRVKITRDMSPNFVFSAALFHGGQTYRSELKVVAPPREKFLNVTVTPDRRVYRPGETVNLTIATSDSSGTGRSAEVSLGVVDAALYQLQSDPTPDMARFFYHPRRNNVLTNLSSEYRFFGYAEEKRLQLALNQGSLAAALTAIKDDGEARRNFKDQTFWDAKLTTDSQGKARISFLLADNLTEWKVTARAITSDTRVGETTATFVARKDLQIQAGIPPYLYQDRDQTIAAAVSNLTKDKQRIVVTVDVENATISGKNTRTVELEPGAQAPVYFSLRTGKSAPASHDSTAMQIRFSARSGQLFDSSEHSVLLKPYGLQRNVSGHLALDSEADDSDELSLALPERHARPKLTIRVSPGSGMAVRQSLAYLADYPYGCIEQTMSRFMPVLAARQAGFISPRLQREAPQMAQWGLARIRQHQNDDGGFGWYGADRESDVLMTAYVYRGLAISGKLGFETEDRLVNRARAFLYGSLSRGELSLFERAYVLFALSEGAPVEASMVQALAASAYKDGQSDYGRALVALTLINHQQADAARPIVQKLIENTNLAKDRNGTRFNGPAYVGAYGEWRNDPVEFAAALLTAAARLRLHEDIRSALVATLLVNRGSQDGLAWKNSRDTAWAVLALTEALRLQREQTGDARLQIKINGKQIRDFTVSAAQVDEGDLLWSVAGADLQSGANQIRVEKTGGPALHVAAILEFYDRSDSFAATDAGLSIQREYARVSVTRNDDGTLRLATSGGKRFIRGDLIMVSLRVRNSEGSARYYQISDSIPPGFSPVERDQEYYSADRAREYDNRQIYDDRAVFFVAGPTGETTIRYFLRANLPGTYRALPARATLMYYPERAGSTGDDPLEVAIE